MANDPTLLVPELTLNPEEKPSWDEMERRLYDNFTIIRALLIQGLTTNTVAGTMKSYYTNGLLTRWTTAT